MSLASSEAAGRVIGILRRLQCSRTRSLFLAEARRSENPRVDRRRQLEARCRRPHLHLLTPRRRRGISSGMRRGEPCNWSTCLRRILRPEGKQVRLVQPCLRYPLLEGREREEMDKGPSKCQRLRIGTFRGKTWPKRCRLLHGLAGIRFELHRTHLRLLDSLVHPLPDRIRKAAWAPLACPRVVIRTVNLLYLHLQMPMRKAMCSSRSPARDISFPVLCIKQNKHPPTAGRVASKT